jgi:hypothetical protein
MPAPASVAQEPTRTTRCIRFAIARAGETVLNVVYQPGVAGGLRRSKRWCRATSFFKDMRAFFAEENAIKRDEIAARQLQALRGYILPRSKKLRLSDVHEMFLQMRDDG